MVQFALYERIESDGKYSYICCINSVKNINKVFNIHQNKSDGEIHMITLSDNENIPYQLSE